MSPLKDGQDRLEYARTRVEAMGVELREYGSGYRGDCVHCGRDDRMEIKLDYNEHVWFFCHGRCPHDDIVGVLGLSDEELRGRREPARGRVTFASEVKAEPVRWLIEGQIPLGAVSLLAGDPKLGKSTLSAVFAAGVSLGKFGGEPATTLVLSAEDSFTRNIKPRVYVAGAALDRIGQFAVEDIDGVRFPDLPEDIGALRDAVAEHQAKLVIVDPLNAFLSGAIDSWKDHGVRRALAPLSQLADELDCAILVIVHLNKQRGGEPIYRIGGSIGHVAAARSVLGFGRDPDDPDGERGSLRLLGHLACNWGPLTPTQQWEFEKLDIELDDHLMTTSRLLFRGETEQSAADAFGARAREERGQDAEEAIADALDDGEPHPSRVIKSAVIAELGVSSSSVDRAAKRMRDRGELEILERGSSAGDKAIGRRSTEWRLLDRVKPIAERDVIELDHAVEPKTLANPARSRHDGNDVAEVDVIEAARDVIESGNGAGDLDAALEESIRRAQHEPDPPWLSWR